MTSGTVVGDVEELIWAGVWTVCMITIAVIIHLKNMRGK
jgi:hypothetical protein